jgi:uncharacterized membrane protein YdjX (TVP38/TMEM64 family)
MNSAAMNYQKKIWIMILTGMFVFAVMGILYFWFRAELFAVWSAIQSQNSPPELLIASFAVLPVFGFPVSPFLVLLGLRFGYGLGIIVMLVIMPVHLIISYWVTHSFLREWVEILAKKNNLNITRISESQRMRFGFIFMVVPGLSYTIKNYLLPLSGLSFFQFFVCGWVTQAMMGIPFVVLGNSAAQLSIPVFIGMLGLIFVMLIFRKRIFKQYNRIVKSELKENET